MQLFQKLWRLEFIPESLQIWTFFGYLDHFRDISGILSGKSGQIITFLKLSVSSFETNLFHEDSSFISEVMASRNVCYKYTKLKTILGK